MLIKWSIPQKIKWSTAYGISSIDKQLWIKLSCDLCGGFGNPCFLKVQLVGPDNGSRKRYPLYLVVTAPHLFRPARTVNLSFRYREMGFTFSLVVDNPGEGINLSTYWELRYRRIQQNTNIAIRNGIFILAGMLAGSGAA